MIVQTFIQGVGKCSYRIHYTMWPVLIHTEINYYAFLLLWLKLIHYLYTFNREFKCNKTFYLCSLDLLFSTICMLNYAGYYLIYMAKIELTFITSFIKKNYDQNVSFNKKCSQVVGASSFTGSVQTYSAFVLGVSRVRALVWGRFLISSYFLSPTSLPVTT